MTFVADASPNPFPKVGIKISYIAGPFLDILRKHQVDIRGKQTRQIRQAIIDITRAEKASYCDCLVRQGLGSAVSAKPNAFISHAHDLLFEDLLSALTWHFRHEPDAVVWLDIFSINQHEPIKWTFDWLTKAFKGNVADIGRTVMIMTPWKAPLPYTRSWCIFECCATVQVGATFEMAMSERDEEQFLEKIWNNATASINQLLASVRSEKSQCSVPSDRAAIFEAIRSTVGFSKLDSMVFEKYREWVIQVTHQALDACTGSGEGGDNTDNQRRKLLYSRAMGDLYGGQGKQQEAILYREQALETSERIHGVDHPETVKAMNNLANSYNRHGQYGKAAKLYRDCLLKQQSIFGHYHQETLRTMNNLATSLRRLGQCWEAVCLYRTCFVKKASLLGLDHPETLRTMNNLAISLQGQRLHSQAEELFRSCLDKKKEVLGEDHTDTLRTSNCLAGLLRSQGQFEEAGELYRDCMEKQKVTLAEDHPEVLRTMQSLAMTLRDQGCDHEAKDLFRSCWDKQKVHLGTTHPETLRSMYELGVSLVLCQQKDPTLHKERAEAERLLSLCLKLQTANPMLGEHHSWTAETRRMFEALARKGRDTTRSNRTSVSPQRTRHTFG